MGRRQCILFKVVAVSSFLSLRRTIVELICSISRCRSYTWRVLREVSTFPIVGSAFTLSRFRFGDHAAALNVSTTDLYTALLADAETQPPNWNLQGRQADVWKRLSESNVDPFTFHVLILWHVLLFFCSLRLFVPAACEIDFIPHDMFDGGGANSKQVSRTLEVCFHLTIFGVHNT